MPATLRPLCGAVGDRGALDTLGVAAVVVVVVLAVADSGVWLRGRCGDCAGDDAGDDAVEDDMDDEEEEEEEEDEDEDAELTDSRNEQVLWLGVLSATSCGWDCGCGRLGSLVPIGVGVGEKSAQGCRGCGGRSVRCVCRTHRKNGVRHSFSVGKEKPRKKRIENSMTFFKDAQMRGSSQRPATPMADAATRPTSNHDVQSIHVHT